MLPSEFHDHRWRSQQQPRPTPHATSRTMGDADRDYNGRSAQWGSSPQRYNYDEHQQHPIARMTVAGPPPQLPASTALPLPLPPLRATLFTQPEDLRRHTQQQHTRERPWVSDVAPPPAQRPRLDLFAPFATASSSAFAAPLRGTAFRSRMDSGEDEEHDDEDEHEDHFDVDHRGHHHERGHASHHHSDQQHQQQQQQQHMSAAAKKRSRRMSNSERGKLYRSRRKEYVETLEEEVEALKRQVEAMRLHNTKTTKTSSSSTSSSSSSGQSPVMNCSPYDTALLVQDRSRAGSARIVCEYFSLFQFGVPVTGQQQQHQPSHSPPGAPSPQLSNDAIVRSTRQVGFLQALMDPNMRFGDNFGVQMLLEQWERYSTYHSALKYDLDAMEIHTNEPTALVTASATLKVRFSRKTIEKVFPHVLWNEPLVQRLIGLEVEYPVINKFYFGSDGKIRRYETEVDFVSAFIKALGSQRDAMQLVGNALIMEQHRIGPDEETLAVPAATRNSYSPSGSSSQDDTGSNHSQSPMDASNLPLRHHATNRGLRQTEPSVKEEESSERTRDGYAGGAGAAGGGFPTAVKRRFSPMENDYAYADPYHPQQRLPYNPPEHMDGNHGHRRRGEIEERPPHFARSTSNSSSTSGGSCDRGNAGISSRSGGAGGGSRRMMPPPPPTLSSGYEPFA